MSITGVDLFQDPGGKARDLFPLVRAPIARI